MEFPHLNDTNFPHLNNVDVYSYHNNFDYTRWVVGTTIRLVNVLWDANYDDVVKFEDNETRDNWFMSLDDFYEIELTTNAQSVPDGQIKLPIPYDVMSRYNYMVVRIPEMPGSGTPIVYENHIAEHAVRTWFYFIDSIEYRAPNTTLCNITLDVWTEYINDLTISYFHVDRTHAAVAVTDVEEYLENPIENNKYLLTPDVTPAGADIVRSCNYISFGSGKKWMIIACTVKPSQLPNLGTISPSSDYTYSSNITFLDDGTDPFGYQMRVRNYGIGNGYDYSDIRALCDQTAANGAKIPNGLNTYAVDCAEVWGEVQVAHFFQDIITTCPTFMRTIEACFVVDESMFELMSQTPYQIAGHDIWWVRGTEVVEEMPQLTVADFNFPAVYQRFAKLYTFPYSKMELTDNEGNKVTVRIENLSNSRYVHKIAQLTFPFTNLRMFFSGINGKGANEYVWKNLVDTDINKRLPKSDWFDYCFDHDIPCYALYMDGDTDWMLDHFNTFAKAAKANDLAAYRASARMADAIRLNTQNSAATANTNAIANADAAQANQKAIAETNDLNEKDNLDLSEALTALSQNYATDMTNDNISQVSQMTNQANDYSAQNSSIQNDNSVATANEASSNAQVQGSIGGIGAAAGMAALAAGPVGVVGAAALAGASITLGVSAGAANAQNILNTNNALIAKNSSLVQATRNNNIAVAGITTTHALEQKRLSNVYARKQFEAKRDTLLDKVLPRNKDLADDNADRTHDAAVDIADNTKETADDNATNMRLAEVLNAQEIFKAKALASQAYIEDARMKKPVKIGTYSGNPNPDWNMNRGVQVKIKTMSDSEVAEVGDFFVRFGYAINRIWHVSNTPQGLCPMNYFCYWKANEVWFDDRLASTNNAQKIIQAIFMRGVTVWKNGNMIGKVNPYAN